MEISGGGEETEDMLSFPLWVLEIGNGAEVGESNLFKEAFFRRGFINREEIRAQDEEV